MLKAKLTLHKKRRKDTERVGKSKFWLKMELYHFEQIWVVGAKIDFFFEDKRSTRQPKVEKICSLILLVYFRNIKVTHIIKQE